MANIAQDKSECYINIKAEFQVFQDAAGLYFN